MLFRSLSANYAFDALWSFGAGISYRTLASPSTQNYSINDLGLTLSVNRAVGTGSLQAGVAANFSDYQSVGPVVVMREDEENFGTFISHRMGLFDERVGLSSTVRYSKNSGQQDWSRFQRSEEHTSELQSRTNLVCRLLLEKKKKKKSKTKGIKEIKITK